MIYIKNVSSLEKILFDTDINSLAAFSSGTALKGERFNYQVVISSDKGQNLKLTVETISDINIDIKSVGYVQCDMPASPWHDDFIISDKPGLYPDTLEQVSKNGICVGPHPHVLWISVNSDIPGEHRITLIFRDLSGDEKGRSVFTLETVNEFLPEQKLIYTNWFHADCLADEYNVEAFSEKHWEIIEKYMLAASENGMNMILTPVFTPALDTAVGGERTTVQLVDVYVENGKYRFCFDKLKRWTDTAVNAGMKYLEICPMFTQWGATNAPKIMAYTDTGYRRIFGWETDASGKEYSEFLSEFIPQLVSFFKDIGRDNMLYFHVSDEPYEAHLDIYSHHADIINKCTGGKYPVIDAMSDYNFYKLGYIKIPVASTSHAEPFLANIEKNRWIYYCCGQCTNGLSNRFISMPSVRNRIIGVQMYVLRIDGFLQWGFNFWNSQYSLEKIDPYRVTDARCAFPAGDGFVVYPGRNGEPVLSLRLRVFAEALQDLRALQLLEQKIGREKTLELIGCDITLNNYPRDPQWLLNLRDRVNRKLAE